MALNKSMDSAERDHERFVWFFSNPNRLADIIMGIEEDWDLVEWRFYCDKGINREKAKAKK